MLTKKTAVGCFGEVAFLIEKSQETDWFGKQKVENTVIVRELDARYVNTFVSVLFLSEHIAHRVLPF